MRELLSILSVEIVLIFLIPIIGSEMIRTRGLLDSWSLKRWWLVLAGASALDLASTYFVVYVRVMTWEVEQNWLVLVLGPSVGHGLVLVLENVVALVLFYIIACKVRCPRRLKFLRWFFCIVSGVRIGAALCNVLLSF